jgi:hypothetical protein
MEILPPQVHIHLALLMSAGIFMTFTCPPGLHGAVITGMHGIGVRTPIAAAVAEATCGLAIDWNMPKGMIFTIGAKSMMLAMSMLPHLGRSGTITFSVEGAIPKLHWSIAP